jgi:hypothetical protein
VKDDEERSLGVLGWCWDGEQHPHQGAQKPLEPTQEQIEVVALGGEHGIDAVAVAAFEIIAAHPVLGLDVPNDRLDSDAATHLAADRGGDAAHLAADPDAEFLGMVMTAIAFVDVDAAGLDPVSASSSAMTGPRVWTSKGLPCNALAYSTFGLGGRGPPTPVLSQVQAVSAEFVRRPGLPLADAFDLRGVQRIDLGAALPVILKTHLHRQREPVGEAFLERLVAGDLAPDVADPGETLSAPGGRRLPAESLPLA